MSNAVIHIYRKAGRVTKVVARDPKSGAEVMLPTISTTYADQPHTPGVLTLELNGLRAAFHDEDEAVTEQLATVTPLAGIRTGRMSCATPNLSQVA